MKVRSKLQNPVVLALEGFVAGGLLFLALPPLAGAERQPSPIGDGSVLETLQAG